MRKPPLTRLLGSALSALALLGVPAAARAVDLTRLDDKPLRLDVTATTLANYHSDNRNSIVYDDGYGELLNRLNFSLAWWRVVAAVRLDTATFGLTPEPATLARRQTFDVTNPESLQDVGLVDSTEIADREDLYRERLRSRYRSTYYLGKAYATYTSPNVEVTAGDSYVSFGRGLVLSLRKQDELAIDTTLFGGKATLRAPGVSFTAVGGVANPVRIDEATGQTLDPVEPTAAELAAGKTPAAVFGQDRLVGARLETNAYGASFAVHGVRLMRTDTVGETSGPRAAPSTDVVGTSLQAPLPNAGLAYVEGALQSVNNTTSSTNGYALYGSLSGALKSFTGVVELQHYRDFQPLVASIDRRRAEAFQFLRYSAPPTTEPVTTDTRLLFFDQCVTGGRARVDNRLSESVLVYGSYGRWASWGERGNQCLADEETALRNDVNDLGGGLQISFDEGRSRAFASGGWRYDNKAENDQRFYREVHGEATVAKAIRGPFSLELEHKLRRRLLVVENGADPWFETETYFSAKYSPKFIAALGMETTGLRGYAPTYFNGTLVYRYTSDSSVKLFAGQQRGALKCVSGVCREFPPFEGVKLEWTQRY